MKLLIETIVIGLSICAVGCTAAEGDDLFRSELSGTDGVEDGLTSDAGESGGVGESESGSGGESCACETCGDAENCWSCGVYDEAAFEAEVEACEVGSESGGTDGETGGPIPVPDGAAQAGAGPYGFANGIDPAADKKGACYGTYPAGCNQLDGTTILSVRWMENFRHGTISNPWTAAPGTFNQLTGAQEDQIVNLCKDRPTVIEKVICAGHLVDTALDGTEDKNGTSVCRHHMAGLRAVLIKMGLGDTTQGSMTHAWNELSVDTNGDGVADVILIADSYNDIYYTVPK